MAEIDVTSIVEEIVTKVTEEKERFIFETIQPYCEEVTKMEISKEDLKEALTVWQTYKSGAFTRKTGKWVDSKRHIYWECTCCGWYNDVSNRDFHYCPNCGARMEVAK